MVLFDGHAPEASLAALDVFPEAASILVAGSWREGTATLAGKVDCVAAPERFALQATEQPDLRPEEHRRDCKKTMREMFARTVVITLGENGLIVDDDGGFVHLPAFPVEKVDSTAAGDIFHGALAFGIAKSMPLMESLRFASKAAALSVQVRGGRRSIPRLDRAKQATHLD